MKFPYDGFPNEFTYRITGAFPIQIFRGVCGVFTNDLTDIFTNDFPDAFTNDLPTANDRLVNFLMHLLMHFLLCSVRCAAVMGKTTGLY